MVVRGRCCLLLALLVAACNIDTSHLSEPLQSGRVLALDGLEGRWVGPVAPTTPDCGKTTQGLMAIGETGFGFDPFEGAIVISGKVTDDGHLNGELVRQGGDHQTVSISFSAAASGSDAIAGSLQSGRCHWTVTLHRG